MDLPLAIADIVSSVSRILHRRTFTTRQRVVVSQHGGSPQLHHQLNSPFLRESLAASVKIEHDNLAGPATWNWFPTVLTACRHNGIRLERHDPDGILMLDPYRGALNLLRPIDGNRNDSQATKSFSPTLQTCSTRLIATCLRNA